MNTIKTGPSNNARDYEVWSRSWTHFRVDRRSPRYCHVTFDHPPINTITATTVAELSDLAASSSRIRISTLLCSTASTGIST